MARVTIDVFAEKELEMVHMARTVDEAERVEATLTDAGIDYVIEMEPYMDVGIAVLLPTTERQGASFYVLAGQAAYCRTLLNEAGLSQDLMK
jgi:hypothetical protein